MQRKKIGLALGGGGVKGMAHIGVLQILEKQGIPIDYIAGTSMGAVIAALYAHDPNAKKLEKEMGENDLKKLFDYTIPKHGLIKGDKVKKLLREKIKGAEFKDMAIPLYITAVDNEEAREVIFSKGDVAKAVRASISLPGIFVPVINKNRILVDGAIMDPIPTEILRRVGADIIISVNVNDLKIDPPIYNEPAVKGRNKKIRLPNVISSATKSFHILTREVFIDDIKDNPSDFFINVPLRMDTMDFRKKNVIHAIRSGRRATRKSIKALGNIAEPSVFKIFLDGLRDINNKVKRKIKIKKIFNPGKKGWSSI